MPTPADKLAALAAVSIADATAALARGGSVGAWREAMGRAITRAHTAAQIAAAAERGVGGRIRAAVLGRLPVPPELLMSRAERETLRANIGAQMRYLDAFAAQVKAGGLSERAIMARALSYAGSVKAPYYAARWGDWDIPVRLLPGMQTCMGNCLCQGSVIDNGDGTGIWRRAMGGTERHCTECPGLAGDHEVRRRRAA